jgi:RNA polymerase sigma-70 factor (ECF subfamily)
VNYHVTRVHHDEPPPSWRSWLSTHARRFFLFAREQTRCDEDAQDVLQESLVESWRRGGEGGTPPAAALVFATIRRRAIDLARSNIRRKNREQLVAWFEPAPTADPAVDKELEDAVKNLPPLYREVITLKVWGGLTFEETAEVLGVPPNTAASRYRYAISQLRESMKRSQP